MNITANRLGGVIAAWSDSSQGSATVTPAPRSTARRDKPTLECCERISMPNLPFLRSVPDCVGSETADSQLLILSGSRNDILRTQTSSWPAPAGVHRKAAGPVQEHRPGS